MYLSYVASFQEPDCILPVPSLIYIMQTPHLPCMGDLLLLLLGMAVLRDFVLHPRG